MITEKEFRDSARLIGEPETFKDVPGYEGIYMISDKGALFVRTRTWKSGRKESQVKCRPAFIMKPKKEKQGYIYYELYKDGKGKKLKAHRLVALAFLPNPENLPHVNHKNGNKSDNRLANLEWCTASYNVQHAFDVLGRKPTWLGTGRSSGDKIVLQMNDAGEIVKEYPNCGFAAKDFGIGRAYMSQIVRGEREKFGFKWAYKDSLR